MATTHLTTVPESFRIEAYLGVVTILAVGLALTAATALLLSDSRPVWVLALCEGVLSVGGYVVTRLVGLPLATDYLVWQWSQPQELAVGLLGTVVAGLAAWTLHKRRGLPRVPTPVTSAQQRELLLRSSRRRRPSRSRPPGSVRKASPKSPE